VAEQEAHVGSTPTRPPVRRVGAKRANGQRIGAVPYGHDMAEDDVILVPNEPEQTIIQSIKAMRARGMKLQQIASNLTAHGVPTKTGKSLHWTHQAVVRILGCSELHL